MSERIAQDPPRRRGAAALAAAACAAGALVFGVSTASAEPQFPYMPPGSSEGFVVSKSNSGPYGPAGCNANRSVVYCWGDSVNRPSASAKRRCDEIDATVVWRLTRTGKATRGFTCNGGVLGTAGTRAPNLIALRSKRWIGSFDCAVGKSRRGSSWRTITCENSADRRLTYQARITF